MKTKINDFAKVLEIEQLNEGRRQGLTYPGWEDCCKVAVHYGKKFARVDVGTSGKYMVDLSDGVIYGIKAYGVAHRGHTYGTLDTINQWNWSGYVGQPLTAQEAA